MIHHAVGLISTRLNQHLRSRLNSPDDLVAVTNLTDHEGKPAAAARNKVVIFVTDIAEETTARGIRPRISSGGRVPVNPDPVHLNVFFMLAANFDPDNYMEALKILSASVQFFQGTPIFDPQNAPEMPEGLDQISCEINNLSEDTNSHLWGIHGGRYVPSVHYKMRMIAIDSGMITGEDFAISSPDTGAVAKGKE